MGGFKLVPYMRNGTAAKGKYILLMRVEEERVSMFFSHICDRKARRIFHSENQHSIVT